MLHLLVGILAKKDPYKWSTIFNLLKSYCYSYTTNHITEEDPVEWSCVYSG